MEIKMAHCHLCGGDRKIRSPVVIDIGVAASGDAGEARKVVLIDLPDQSPASSPCYTNSWRVSNFPRNPNTCCRNCADIPNACVYTVYLSHSWVVAVAVR